MKSINRVIARCVTPSVASKVLLAIGILYFGWIFIVLFSSSNNNNNTSSNNNNNSPLNAIKNYHVNQPQQSQPQQQQPPQKPQKPVSLNNNNQKEAVPATNNLAADANMRQLLDAQCFTTRYVYLVIPVSSQDDIDDLCSFNDALLQDTGIRTTMRSSFDLSGNKRKNMNGRAGGAGARNFMVRAEQQVLINSLEEFVAVVDPLRCGETDDPLKCGWIHRRPLKGFFNNNKKNSETTNSSSNNKNKFNSIIPDSIIRGWLPEIKVRLFISAATDELYASALSKANGVGPQSCQAFKSVGNNNNNNNERNPTMVTVESVSVVPSSTKKTLDGALASGLHRALMAARHQDFPNSEQEEAGGKSKKTLPPLSLRAHTHFIASMRSHLIPTSPGLLRVLLDTIIRSGEISPSRPSALNNVPLGMSSRYPCTVHPFTHFSAATSDLTVLRRDATDRFSGRIAGVSCMGLVSEKKFQKFKHPTTFYEENEEAGQDDQELEDMLMFSENAKERANERGTFGRVSTAGNSFALLPSRFEGNHGERVLSVELQRQFAKRRFKLVHHSRRRPLEVDDDSMRMSRDHVISGSDVLSGSCFMMDAAALETALAGESLQSVESFTSAAWQERIQQLLIPPANSPVHIRETESKMLPLVNAERRILFLYNMIVLVNETIDQLRTFRKVLAEQDAQRKVPYGVPKDAYDDPELHHRKWAFDDFEKSSRMSEAVQDARTLIEEIGFSKHIAYLEDSGWWLSIPTSNVSTNFKTGAYYRCRIGDATFYSLVHCWSTLLGVRFADPDFIADQQGTSKFKERRQITRAVDLLETIFSKSMDPHTLFMTLDLDSLKPAFQLVKSAIAESALRYRHLTETLRNAIHLSPDSEARLELSVAGLCLSMREQLKTDFATALLGRVEDISLSRFLHHEIKVGGGSGPGAAKKEQKSSLYFGSQQSASPFSIILPPSHPLRAYLLTVDSIKSRIIEKKNCIMLPFWIDVGGSTICESERHVDSIFGALPGTTPWTVSPLTISTHDSSYTFVGSRSSCSSNGHDTHKQDLDDEMLLSKKLKEQQNQEDPFVKEMKRLAEIKEGKTSLFAQLKKDKKEEDDQKQQQHDPAANNNNNNNNNNLQQQSPDEKENNETSIHLPSASPSWCASSCSHPAGHSYYEAAAVSAHIYPFTSSHSHAVTVLTGHADVLASQLSVHASLLQAFVPFSLSWILGRAANSAVLLSGMEQFRLSHGTIRFALCFTYWCSEMMQRFADDTMAIFRVAYPHVPASLFDPLETRQLFRKFIAPSPRNNDNNKKLKQESTDDAAAANNNKNFAVVLPGGISFTRHNKMNRMSSSCSFPVSTPEDQKNQESCTHDGDGDDEPFIIGAPVPWEKGNATRALESISRLVRVIESVQHVYHCRIQVIVLLLHAPALLKIESVIQPFLDRLNSAESMSKISICIFSTEGVKWNDHDTADFLSSSTIIIHPLNPTGWPHLAIQSLLLSKPIILPHCCGLSELALPHEAFFADIVGADVEHRGLVNSVGENIIVRHWTFHVNLTQVARYIETLQRKSFLRYVVARRGHIQATRKASGVDPHTIYRTMRFVAGQMQSVVIDAVKNAAQKTNVQVSEETIRRVLGMQDDRFQLS